MAVIEERPKEAAGLWMRLLGFALVPLVVQAFQPAIGGALGIMTPLPLAYGMARRGYLEGTAAVAFVGLLTSVVLGAGQGLYFLIETLPLCVGIRWTVRSRGPLHRPVIRTVVMAGGAVLGSVLVYAAISGTAPGELYHEAIRSMGLFMGNIPGNSGLTPQEQQHFQWMVELWQRLFVGIWLATLLLLVTFYSLLVRGWMIAAGVVTDDGAPRLSRWRMPFGFVPAFILVACMVLLTAGTARDAAINILIPIGTLYGIQGIVVAGHMFTRWALPSFFRIVILAFGIITFPLGFMILAALIGLFDTWADFRQRWPLQTPPPPVT